MRPILCVLLLALAACGRAGSPEAPEGAISPPDRDPAYSTTTAPATPPAGGSFLLDPLI